MKMYHFNVKNNFKEVNEMDEEKERKTIPIDPNRFDLIKKRIGRKKLDNNEKYCDLKKLRR